MVIKYKLTRLSQILFLVLILPLIQKQWLNLYLFDINKFSIYKLLYYLSGLIFPILVIKKSLGNFTFYKFTKRDISNTVISGIKLLVLTSSTLIILSTLISSYILINLRILFNLFINENNFWVLVEIDKKVLLVVVIMILLLFRKFKLLDVSENKKINFQFKYFYSRTRFAFKIFFVTLYLKLFHKKKYLKEYSALSIYPNMN